MKLVAEDSAHNDQELKQDVDLAGSKATKYITDTSNGIFVHPDGKGLDYQGEITPNSTGWRIADALEYFKNGISHIKMWLENGFAKLRLGDSNKAHLEIDYHSMQLKDPEGTYFYVSDSRQGENNVKIKISKYTTYRTPLSIGTIPTPPGITYDLLDYGIYDLTDWKVMVGSTDDTSNWSKTTSYVVKDGIIYEVVSDITRIVGYSTPTLITITLEGKTRNLSRAFTFGSRSDEFIGATSVGTGLQVSAAGIASHAEGKQTKAYGRYSHAEGMESFTAEDGGHAEGYKSIAYGKYSHAEGQECEARGIASHAGGLKTKAIYDYQTVIGKYSSEAIDGLAFVIGGGTSSSPKNVFTVNWDGSFVAEGYGIINSWLNVYGDIYSSGSITGSDLKIKNIIEDFDWKVDEFIMGLQPIAYYIQDPDESRYGERIHMGFGAQHIAQLAKDLDLGDMSLYRANIKNDGSDPGDYMDKPYHGEEIDDEQLRWGLNYSELIAPLVLEVQRLMARVDELEKRLEECQID